MVGDSERNNIGNLLECLSYQGGPIFDGPGHVSNVNEVEVILWPCPFAFGVINLKLDIRRDPGTISVCIGSAGWVKERLYQLGWIGLRSVPVTLEDG